MYTQTPTGEWAHPSAKTNVRNHFVGKTLGNICLQPLSTLWEPWWFPSGCSGVFVDCSGALALPLAAACLREQQGLAGALVCSPGPDSSFWAKQELFLTWNMDVFSRQPQRWEEKICLRCTPSPVIPGEWFSGGIPVKRSLRLPTRCAKKKD